MNAGLGKLRQLVECLLLRDVLFLGRPTGYLSGSRPHAALPIEREGDSCRRPLRDLLRWRRQHAAPSCREHADGQLLTVFLLEELLEDRPGRPRTDMQENRHLVSHSLEIERLLLAVARVVGLSTAEGFGMKANICAAIVGGIGCSDRDSHATDPLRQAVRSGIERTAGRHAHNHADIVSDLAIAKQEIGLDRQYRLVAEQVRSTFSATLAVDAASAFAGSGYGAGTGAPGVPIMRLEPPSRTMISSGTTNLISPSSLRPMPALRPASSSPYRLPAAAAASTSQLTARGVSQRHAPGRPPALHSSYRAPRLRNANRRRGQSVRR